MTAMSGSFGYELDPDKLSESEITEIKKQTERFREYEHILHDGSYFRLSDESKMRDYCAWQHVSADGSESILNLVITNPEANANAINIRLKGLKDDALYRIVREDRFGVVQNTIGSWLTGESVEGLLLSSDTLMKAGVTIAPMQGDYPGVQYYLKEEQQTR